MPYVMRVNQQFDNPAALAEGPNAGGQLHTNPAEWGHYNGNVLYDMHGSKAQATYALDALPYDTAYIAGGRLHIEAFPITPRDGWNLVGASVSIETDVVFGRFTTSTFYEMRPEYGGAAGWRGAALYGDKEGWREEHAFSEASWDPRYGHLAAAGSHWEMLNADPAKRINTSGMKTTADLELPNGIVGVNVVTEYEMGPEGGQVWRMASGGGPLHEVWRATIPLTATPLAKEAVFQIQVPRGNAFLDDRQHLSVDYFTAESLGSVNGFVVDPITRTFDFTIHDPNAITYLGDHKWRATDNRFVGNVEADHILDTKGASNDWTGGVDNTFYDRAYRDIAASGMTPAQHYNTYGWREGRDPNALFDTSSYLAANADVARAGINPLDQYMTWGEREGRDLEGFDRYAYAEERPDVAASGMNMMVHFGKWGAEEGVVWA